MTIGAECELIPPAQLLYESNRSYSEQASWRNNQEKRDYWLGVVATADHTQLEPRVFDAALCLRADVYIDELKWLPESSRTVDGREIDPHDEHSTHLAMVDTRLSQENNPFVFANVRYIHRRGDVDFLPVEEEFGLSLGDPLEERVELSRFISRHPNKQTRALGSIALASHTVGMLNRLDMNGYAIMERSLVRRLLSMGMSVETLTEPKPLEDYGGTINYGVRIDGAESLNRANYIASRRGDFPFNRFYDIATNGSNLELVDAIYDYLTVRGKSNKAA